MQMQFLRAFAFWLTLAAISSCKEAVPKDIIFQPGHIEVTSKDFLIPRDLKAHIDSEYLSFIRKENTKVVASDADVLAQSHREFLDVELAFRSSAEGVLSAHTKFALPRGGGEIDLKNYVKGQKGSFFMTVSAQRSEGPDLQVKNLHVYYLSEAKDRIISGEKYGSGCRKYMDITELMTNANSMGGLKLNATAQRYLSVIAGVFYFVEFSASEKIYISAVRITDSRHPELLCE